MDLHHLEYFVAVAEEGGIQRASERLMIAPSALSRRILDLEAELDVDLFERRSSGLALSYAGRALMADARAILEEVAATAEHFRRLQRGHTGLLRIGLSGIAPQLPVVQRLIRSFRVTCPAIELSLPVLNAESAASAVRGGAIDAALLFDPDLGDDLERLPLASYRMVLAMPADHRLASRPSLRLADLEGEALVLPGGGATRDRVLARWREAGLAADATQQAEGEHTLIALVAAGLGVSFMNETVSVRQNRPDLVVRPVEDLDLQEHLDLVWLAGPASDALAGFTAMAASIPQ